ncbi:Trypsin domain containing protein [Asbolus verrucosus]|uniref:Trypsin domain containing protein n=1 Tax=Asbolus verrucosus TaxID=1661398 RepID=A0A482WEZ6_ASBVE|nr:Trypsin domain containing protein [Asbolus verrucosus]
MALLGYRQRQVDFTQFLCGGSIITGYYVLTAAHCITLDRRLELVLIRLGEHDLSTDKDCIKDVRLKDEVCADPPVDIAIEHIRTHPKYDNERLQNDIALIKVRQKIHFTDYVKPICLPFERNLENRDLSKQKLTYTVVTVWNQTACRKNVPPDVKPISNRQLCANGASKEDACKGDSGGPLVNATIDSDGELRYFQIGIVSFASTLTCGNPELPTVYTRVDKFLRWVEENVS